MLKMLNFTGVLGGEKTSIFFFKRIAEKKRNSIFAEPFEKRNTRGKF